MKLDRNNGQGKYAIVDMREIKRIGGVTGGHNPDIAYALRILETNGLIEYGDNETENEFFVIKLKDRYADGALSSYADNALADGEDEYSQEVRALANRSGTRSSWCKKPD